MSRRNPQPFFECCYQDLLDTRRRQRTIKALAIGKQKRQERLRREGKPLTTAFSERHNGVTTIVIRELE